MPSSPSSSESPSSSSDRRRRRRERKQTRSPTSPRKKSASPPNRKRSRSKSRSKSRSLSSKRRDRDERRSLGKSGKNFRSRSRSPRRNCRDRSSRKKSRSRSSMRRRRSSSSRKKSRSSRRRSRSPGRKASPRRRSRSASPRGDRDHPEACNTLGVFGLSYSTSEDGLDRSFKKFGAIENIQLVKDPAGRSRGFGFIAFNRLEDAKRARDSMCDCKLDGKRIRVDYSITRGPHAKTPGRYYGLPPGHPRGPPLGFSPRSGTRRRSPSPGSRDSRYDRR